MDWTILSFGKHKGKILPQILFQDPDWFFWAYRTDAFESRGLGQEAAGIYKKACAIKIPQKGSEKLVAEYCFEPKTGKFADLELVPSSRPCHIGSSRCIRKDVINLKVPIAAKKYDKLGCKLLVSSLKHYLFGDRRYTMTKKRCEEFYDDDSNFDI